MKIKYRFLGALLVCVQWTCFGVQEKEWAFLIFLNGHNNLVEYGDLNLNQLETVGSTKEVDVIVQWAKLGNQNTYRLRVEKDNDFNKVTSPILETLPRVDMGDYKKLVEFVRWAVERFPAKHYFISFWNHGSGWQRRNQPVMRGISFDDYSGNHITTEQMGIALKEISKMIGRKVDIVGADACLMAMAEVGSEMADSVDYFVASEETEPGLGWPYHTFYERWAAEPYASAEKISGFLVEEYYKYLSGQMEITLSALNLNQLPMLWAAFRRMNQMIHALPVEKLMAVRSSGLAALPFYYREYVDFGDWLKKVVEGVAGIDIGISSKLQTAISDLVTANKTTPKYKAAQGVAFWLPETKVQLEKYLARYRNLRWSKETGWDESLSTLISLPPCFLRENGQWANEVLEFSSQYGETSWSARQALGACDVATYGDNSSAWAPSSEQGTKEHITVGFASPVYATGAVIRETYGSGFVTQVEAFDSNGEYHVVWAGDDTSAPGTVADFELRWPQTTYLVKGLRVTIDTDKQKSWEEIDSIQLLGK